MILETLNTYCNSGDESINILHPPSHWSIYDRKQQPFDRTIVPSKCNNWLIEDSKKVWNLVLT